MAINADSLRVGGIVPLSLTDFPGRLATVIFCQGCPWRCSYCHNPHLLPRHSVREIDWETVVAFLRRRRGLLDAVVFSGGEPTLQTALAPALREVRQMGFEVGLHTAGIDPFRLREILPLVDWVGLDIKTAFDNYAGVTGAPHSGRRARQSLATLLKSGVAHEIRTTVDPQLLSPTRLLGLAADLAHCGVRHYVLQEYRAPGCAGKALQKTASYLTDAFLAAVSPLFSTFSVRRV